MHSLAKTYLMIIESTYHLYILCASSHSPAVGLGDILCYPHLCPLDMCPFSREHENGPSNSLSVLQGHRSCCQLPLCSSITDCSPYLNQRSITNEKLFFWLPTLYDSCTPHTDKDSDMWCMLCWWHDSLPLLLPGFNSVQELWCGFFFVCFVF